MINMVEKLKKIKVILKCKMLKEQHWKVLLNKHLLENPKCKTVLLNKTSF